MGYCLVTRAARLSQYLVQGPNLAYVNRNQNLFQSGYPNVASVNSQWANVHMAKLSPQLTALVSEKVPVKIETKLPAMEWYKLSLRILRDASTTLTCTRNPSWTRWGTFAGQHGRRLQHHYPRCACAVDKEPSFVRLWAPSMCGLSSSAPGSCPKRRPQSPKLNLQHFSAALRLTFSKVITGSG